jgi:hypothetical protein
VEKLKHFHTAGGNVKWYSHNGKPYGNSSKKYEEFPYDLATPLLNRCPKEVKAGTQIFVFSCA